MTAALRVLFVCEGNLCRSPYADAVFRHRMRSLGSSVVARSSSAGTRATPGAPVHPVLATLAQGELEPELWPDLHAHRARRVDRDLVREHDLVVTMTRRQRTELLEVAPSALRRTWTLGEVAKAADAVLTSGAAGPLCLDGAYAGLDLSTLVSRASTGAPGVPDDVADPVAGGRDDFARMTATVDHGVQRLVDLVLAHGGATASRAPQLEEVVR